jgi:CYTH domain-containing protein
VHAYRQFLIASFLARLIEKERGGERVQQGYFPDQPHRSTYVQVDDATGQLVLITPGPRGPAEEVASIPRSQAEALLELAVRQVDYLSISLSIGTHTAAILRLIAPGPLDLITVPFEHNKLARRFQPPAWFGPEVTDDPAYQARFMALDGLPSRPELEDYRRGAQQPPGHRGWPR